jgi:hypothetical protein
MWRELQFQLRLAALQRSKDAAQRYHNERVEAARKARDRAGEQDALSALFHVDDELDEKIAALVSGRLLDEAEALLLPQIDARDWQEGPVTGKSFLTRESMVALRKAIRDEHSARSKAAAERRAGIIAYASLAVGLIGALTGLAAVMTRH